MMADLALVFHWPPEVMENMAPEELAEWHQEARARHSGEA
jgi:hypothetical protein